MTWPWAESLRSVAAILGWRGPTRRIRHEDLEEVTQDALFAQHRAPARSWQRTVIDAARMALGRVKDRASGKTVPRYQLPLSLDNETLASIAPEAPPDERLALVELDDLILALPEISPRLAAYLMLRARGWRQVDAERMAGIPKTQAYADVRALRRRMDDERRREQEAG